MIPCRACEPLRVTGSNQTAPRESAGGARSTTERARPRPPRLGSCNGRRRPIGRRRADGPRRQRLRPRRGGLEKVPFDAGITHHYCHRWLWIRRPGGHSTGRDRDPNASCVTCRVVDLHRHEWRRTRRHPNGGHRHHCRRETRRVHTPPVNE